MTAPQTRGLLLRGAGGSRRTLSTPFEQGVAGRTVATPFEQSGPLATATLVTPFWQWGDASRTVATPFDVAGTARASVETPFSVLDATTGVDDWGGIIQPLMGWLDPEPPTVLRYRETLVSQPGIRGYWRLGEASGTAAADELGISPGTYVGSPSLGYAGMVVNDADTAVTFGSGSYVSIPDPAGFLHPGDDAVLACIFERSGTGAAETIWSGGAGDLWVGFDAADHLVIAKQGSGAVWTSTPTYTDSARRLLVAYKQGSSRGAYIDGAAVAGSGTNAALAAASGEVRIGALTSGGQTSEAALDEVALLTGADPAALSAALHALRTGA